MVHCNLLPLLSTLLFLLSLPGPLCCGASEYYVKPTEDTPCPEPCHTLIEYAKNYDFFTSVVNVTLSFLPGVHPLNRTLFVTGANNVSFRALPTVAGGSTSTVTILCDGGLFSIFVVSNMTIEHLIFSRCGSSFNPNSINLGQVDHLRVVGVTIEKGWPIVAFSIGYTEIVDSVFASNRQIECLSSSAERCSSAMSMSFVTTPVVFINTTFENNVCENPTGATSTISLYLSSSVTFVNCSFRGNIGTPILASFNSTFQLSSNMSFVSNIGVKGGAMAFYASSRVIFDNRTNILFQNNSAVVGGCMFADFGFNAFYACFFSVYCQYNNVAPAAVSLEFVNNTSQFGGNAIYGASLDTCALSCSPPEVIHNISSFEPNDDISKITSLPSRVCLCDKDGMPDCASSVQSIYPPPMYRFPGETFSISAVVVGDVLGTVSGSVYAQFLLLNKSRNIPQLRTLQATQRVGHNSCTDLEYSVLSNNRSEILVFTVGETSVNSFLDESILERIIANYEEFGHITPMSLPLLTVPVYFNITLLLCPLGFTLASPPGECVCEQRVQENNITCNITDQTLRRSGTIWISASSANDGVIIAEFCPFDYCKSDEVAVNLSNPDSQCNFNHSGILCGGCKPRLSVALGSSQCRSCSNTYLVLIVSFAIAGIALVFFIKLLNLTVSKGTINGLIFYVNIVGAIPSTFFPAGASNFLTVFIAWLNLDLGIETCFFDGLDAYWNTWLQFIFPAYIWAIIGLIIFLSRLSQLATKIFGNNSADVLATLLLLSYAKLLRTIISALSFSFLEMPDGSRVAVWSLDGNIPYLSGKHIPLFLIALAVLLLLWLPFTAVLLFWQLLQRLTHYKIVRWIVIKKRPFFETYFGPLKGEHRYWVGVLLLARGILLIIFAVVPTDETGVDLLSIITVTVVLVTYAANLPHTQQQGEGRRVPAAPLDRSLAKRIMDYLSTFSGWCYKSWYLSLLENSFILNLTILSAATLYVYSSGGNQAAVIYTSVGIAFAQFVGIVCFHSFLLLRKWWKNHTKKVNGELLDLNRAEYEIINEPAPVRGGSHNTLQSCDYREPVLGHYD